MPLISPLMPVPLFQICTVCEKRISNTVQLCMPVMVASGSQLDSIIGNTNHRDAELRKTKMCYRSAAAR